MNYKTLVASAALATAALTGSLSGCDSVKNAAEDAAASADPVLGADMADDIESDLLSRFAAHGKPTVTCPDLKSKKGETESCTVSFDDFETTATVKVTDVSSTMVEWDYDLDENPPKAAGDDTSDSNSLSGEDVADKMQMDMLDLGSPTITCEDLEAKAGATTTCDVEIENVFDKLGDVKVFKTTATVSVTDIKNDTVTWDYDLDPKLPKGGQG
ncbi:MAG TPA: DUF4333 domain-containing protein [Nocardioides sp.]|uniref:DUF4333 domain-containing protein n=1 Tax=uncultured Nocardioides sp. TaxID=198441 RepID=UPI00260AA8B0|nr:DUF4333 domain-containing protein [uncultured Nocardioides sp.]HRD62613.1 DUF4333 domain-containing protein [Nocardioides sp.]HRI95822.1 DUF4333 domain-containing protein [Nocardioides sp.]HRK45959.1 DUF4333 domain-containing protein [Nocardioides sp.]